MIAASSESCADGGPKASGHTCSQLQDGQNHTRGRPGPGSANRTRLGDAPAAEHGEQWVSGRVSHSPLAAHGHELARVATEYPHGPCARVYEQCHASDERCHRRVSATQAAHR